MEKRIKKAGVIGAGVMGATIAAHMANVGIETILLDIVPPELTDADKKKGLTKESKEFRDKFGQNGLNIALKSKPASFYIPENSKLITIGNLEDNYRTIFENYAIGITLADDKERVISWNKYAEELLKMDEQDLFRKHVSSLYPPDEWQKIRMEDIRRKGMKYKLQTKMIRKDESLIDVEVSLCVLKGAAGKTVGSIGIIKDYLTQ